ncbi:cytokine-like nuclear factor N-PAC [Tribolium castaneum]|uniref:cytokine-like nuclear factor N-PAC n=1 Tax=Tribolium castaneum TaxID=7070 RepID=UPI00046C27D9|nr:PREDICTED: putative oxidoreductase GLYR1 homolog [Tribolium castaneum]|eukprot:XP_008192209.1 PREDICTED: putative oxidoreductase GLYR1 homolog [Tribolium castaneum]
MDYEPQIGDLVWAKMKSYSPWPARIVKPGPNSKKQSKKGSHWVYFFGSNNYAWIETPNIKPYEKFKEKFSGLCKSTPFKDAVDDIEDYIKKRSEDSNYDAVFESLLKTESELVKQQQQQSPKKPRKSGASKRQSSDSPRNTSAKKPKPQSPSLKFDENGTSEEPYEEEILNLPPILSKPESPKLDLNKVSVDLKNKNISASPMAFGFMGLGNMGSNVVMNLINSGHRVNLWNRSSQKCDEIKAQADANQLGLVQTYQTPCDVVQNSDVVFSCLADPRSAKEVVIGNCGVIHQAEGPAALAGKGYVEMTSIDPDTSKDICNIIESKGGRYLEAQMQGSKKQAEDGSLIILAAGDKSLFDDCQTCFKAIGKTAFYLGTVGSATKMNLCINMALGIGLAGLAESMVLAERCGLSCKDFLEIFNLSEGASNYLSNKGQLINNRSFSKVEQALEYMQKDIKLCLDISNDVKQNLPVAAAANEAYKTARRSGYDEHDVALVFMKMRH